MPLDHESDGIQDKKKHQPQPEIDEIGLTMFNNGWYGLMEKIQVALQYIARHMSNLRASGMKGSIFLMVVVCHYHMRDIPQQKP